MKIGILTLPLYYNYGGILQAYALQTVLQRQGHIVEVINFPFQLKEVCGLGLIKRFIKKILGKYRGYYINFEHHYNKWLPVLTSRTNLFIQSNILHSLPLKSYDDIKETDYDAIVVGSDQIWRPCMFQENPSYAFLSFAKNWDIKRISYAASFGCSTWEYSLNETIECSKLAKLFDSISVREIDAVQLCKDYLGVEAIQVCDPTLLLSSEDYIKLIEHSGVSKNDGNCFTYILDQNQNITALVKYIADSKGLFPFSVNANDRNERCNIKERIAKPVEMWLRGFYDSDYIITDSFHACVFSILFRKPFIVVVNRKRGASRFESLLGTLGLLDRIIDSVEDYKLLNDDIDYDAVFKKLGTIRHSSYDFLKNAVENEC